MDLSEPIAPALRDYIAQLEQKAKDAQQTTFYTFLKKCHTELSVTMKVSPYVKTEAVKSSLTAPADRPCPRRLKEWQHFESTRQKLFDKIAAVYCSPSDPAPTPFPELLHIKRMREMVENHYVFSELDLRIHEHTNVENMVTRVIDDIVGREELRDAFDLGEGVTFQNHVNNLGDRAEEVRDRPQDPDATDPLPKPANADQISVVERRSGGNSISFLIEYKSPRKLPKALLRQGLRHDMDLEHEIISRAAYSTNEEEPGVEFGYLSTGEVYLFLQIRGRDPANVYYHLAEPKVDVDFEEDGLEAVALSAIGQVLCFCLRACGSRRRDQRWRRDAENACLVWSVNPEMIHAQMTPLQPEPEAPASEYKPVRSLNLAKGGDSSRPTGSLRAGCRENRVRYYSSDPETSDEQDADAESPSARAKRTGSKATKARKNVQSGNNSAGSGHQRLPYCSHKCLSGLTRHGRLDPQCFNRALHPATKSLRHTIDAPTLRILLRSQLDADMDNNCTPPDIQGARGALFKLTLASHGYTLIGKGTVRAFVPDLTHEGRVYERLHQIQGTYIPVCLGNINCIYPYYYDIDVKIVQILLLSWGGVALGSTEYFERLAEICEMEDKLRLAGVEHKDEGCLNVLRDERDGQLMLIDFERATVSQAETVSKPETGRAGHEEKGKKIALGEVSSNVAKKRHWEVDATGDVIGLKRGRAASINELYSSLSA
ncbi:hypothetical protein BDR22DRAFT_963032 [Usnea florida]